MVSSVQLAIGVRTAALVAAKRLSKSGECEIVLVDKVYASGGNIWVVIRHTPTNSLWRFFYDPDEGVCADTQCGKVLCEPVVEQVVATYTAY